MRLILPSDVLRIRIGQRVAGSAPAGVLAGVAFAIASLAGCGQKGPLVRAPGTLMPTAGPGPAVTLPPGAQTPALESPSASERESPRPSP